MSALKFYNYTKAVPIESYAKLKFTCKEINDCRERAKLLLESNLDESINMLENTKDMLELYVLYLLKKVRFDITNTKNIMNFEEKVKIETIKSKCYPLPNGIHKIKFK